MLFFYFFRSSKWRLSRCFPISCLFLVYAFLVTFTDYRIRLNFADITLRGDCYVICQTAKLLLLRTDTYLRALFSNS